VLLGREDERTTLDQLLDAVRRSESRVLVLRGEPGVGKSALLGHAIEQASDFRVVLASGVQSEMELPFAGLQQLCAPLMGHLGALPASQRAALSTAFGLSAGNPPDRFLVGLAALTLLAEAADERPLICAIDDAQWLDEATAQALAFVARRLLAEPIALLFARRDGAAEPGLPELLIEGLRPADAGALLASATHGPMDVRVRDRIVAETRGNPLALLELPRALSPAELAGGFGLPDATALRARIEEGFQRRVTALPAESQLMLLVAAADPLGDPLLVGRAARRLELGAQATHPVIVSGLLDVGERVQFRHPLVRSAVYRGAPIADRLRAHLALADSTDPELDPDRRAWHRAHSVEGLDEAVAEELERSAGRAHARGGMAAAAAFLDKAATLTPDPAQRAARQVAAAQAKLLAGAFDAALALMVMAEAGPLDALHRAQVDLLRAQLAFAVDRGRDAPLLLLEAAGRLERLDLALARETYLDALYAAIFADRRAGAADVRSVARRALTVPADVATVPDLLLDSLAIAVTEGHAAAAPRLRRALDAFCDAALPRQTWLRWVPPAAQAALLLWDYRTWRAVTERRLQAARDDGALAQLPLAQVTQIGVLLFAGETAAAHALLEEMETVAEATATPAPSYGAVAIAAWGGRELEMAAVKRAAARGEGLSETIAQWADAVLYNGLGRYEEALAAAELAAEDPPECPRTVISISGWGLIELVEAAARSGDLDRAAEAVERLAERTVAAGSDWGLGIEARSRALISEGATAERLFREAIERLGRSGATCFVARTHLLYGEWLRRERRRIDAREQLRTAHEQCVAMGFDAFAARAERELQATGAAAGAPVAAGPGVLTPQEAQIARLASDGLSNPAIAARMFISPRTVQHHLHKVFAKLDIHSRNQLTDALSGFGRVASADAQT
jgi:DNA-binding CsgD family transcriptional regulator